MGTPNEPHSKCVNVELRMIFPFRGGFIESCQLMPKQPIQTLKLTIYSNSLCNIIYIV